MKIYTKTGDKGETSLVGGKRVVKNSLRIEAYGTVDELNSVIGVSRSLHPPEEIDDLLGQIQHDLFTLGADLAAPDGSSNIKRIQAGDISRLEQYIDLIEPTLTPLQNFILPGGTQCAATLHFARTVCRRAERFVVQLAKEEHIGAHPVIYLNRLSDLLFVTARKINALGGTSEVTWTQK